MARQTGHHTFINSLGNTTGYKKIYTKKNNNFEKTKGGTKKNSIANNQNLSKIKSNNNEFFPANFTAIKINKLLKIIIANKSGALRYSLFKIFLNFIKKENGEIGKRPFLINNKLNEMINFKLGDFCFDDGFGLKYNFFYDNVNNIFIFRPMEDIDFNKINYPINSNILRFGIVIFSINNMIFNETTKKYFLPLNYNYFLPKVSFSEWLDISSVPIPTFDLTIPKPTPHSSNNELFCVALLIDFGIKNNLYITKLRYKSFSSIKLTYNFNN